ncbi:hypothetical protein HYU20_02175 [Candidatus Woesearchaeota archaeon]|nr:hypothetical protein [Candidatus Woesearchaeota archaeon]
MQWLTQEAYKKVAAQKRNFSFAGNSSMSYTEGIWQQRRPMLKLAPAAAMIGTQKIDEIVDGSITHLKGRID